MSKKSKKEQMTTEAEASDSPPAEPLDETATKTSEEVAPEPGNGELAAQEVLAARDREIAELKKDALYLHAELDNYKRRTERRVRETLEFANEPLVRDLLPVADNLARAIDHAREGGPDGLAGLLQGLDHVLLQFSAALGNHGVEEIVAEGERFDPSVHEAMAQVPGEEDGKVASVYEKGYRLKGRLLRPAKVLVTKVAAPGGGG